MLATLDPGDVEVLLEDPLPHLTERSHTSTSSLLADLATTRNQGFAVDDEEAALNVMCLAVAVDCEPDEPRYAVSTTLFKDRVTPGLKHSLVGDLKALASYLAK
jgi:DNA-binding IclR family transcriptional regulator